MQIRQAKIEEFEEIMENYYVMSDHPGQVEQGAGWLKDIYPTREMIMDAIKAGHYYVVISPEGEIAAGMSLNEAYTEGYEKVNWLVEAKPGEFLSIHALGVMPDYRGQGLARLMVRFANQFAKEKGYKAVRIDVLEVNQAAMKLYPSEGFQFVEKVELYYEDTGLTDYIMFEYIV